MFNHLWQPIRAQLQYRASWLKHHALDALEPRPQVAQQRRIDGQVSVSVVIPTLNGVKDLVQLLPVLHQQRGIANLDLIVVDSGSQDGTVELAQQHQARVIKIASSQFTHSYARNIGAAQAKSPYVCFMVQDALPSSPTWLNQMVYALNANKHCAAVSCIEQPKSDADLFAICNVFLHNEFMGVQNRDRLLRPTYSKKYVTRRRNAQLTNVACLLPRDIAMQYPFEGDYGEDLTLGLRLIDAGYRMVLLNTAPIIHSHNRSASYYFRRSYVGERMTLNVFSDYPLPAVSPHCFITNLAFCLAGLAHLNLILKQVKEHYFIHALEFLRYFISKLEVVYDFYDNEGTRQLPVWDEELNRHVHQVVNTLRMIVPYRFDKEQDWEDRVPAAWLLSRILALVYILERFKNEHRITMPTSQELWSCIINAFGLYTGSMLAAMMHSAPQKALWQQLDQELRTGV